MADGRGGRAATGHRLGGYVAPLLPGVNCVSLFVGGVHVLSRLVEVMP
ncbi:MAG TPA: hypothetical protein VFL66_00760 [Gaiellaceae bacterium]|nr:hypothetical protein [Gaiellaceae bacterium]